MLYKERLRTEVKSSFHYRYISVLGRERLENNKLPGQSDLMLWEAFKMGDEMAFIIIYKKYYRMLFDHGCKYTMDREMVRDCLQDFFLYLEKNRSGFGNTNSIKLYLLRSFKRRVIEYFNKRKNLFTENELFEYTHLGVESCIESMLINNQEKKEQLEKLNKAITTLDSIEQKVIYYFYFKGLNYKQIAGILNFSHVSSARRVMYRSIRKLRYFF